MANDAWVYEPPYVRDCPLCGASTESYNSDNFIEDMTQEELDALPPLIRQRAEQTEDGVCEYRNMRYCPKCGWYIDVGVSCDHVERRTTPEKSNG